MPRIRRSKEDDSAGGGKIPKQKSVRRQIRDTKRLLAREGLPETVKLTRERVLKSLHDELNEKLHNKRSRKLAKKYRRVKFFERAKICKRLKQKVKEYNKLNEDSDRTQVLHEVSQLRMELNYVDNFPPDEKYIALHPSTETTSSHALGRREEVFKHIVEMVESGELPDSSEKISGLTSILSFQSQVPSEALNVKLSPKSKVETMMSKADCSKSASITSTEAHKPSISRKKLKKSEPRESSDSETEIDTRPSKRLKEDNFFIAEN